MYRTEVVFKSDFTIHLLLRWNPKRSIIVGNCTVNHVNAYASNYFVLFLSTIFEASLLSETRAGKFSRKEFCGDIHICSAWNFIYKFCFIYISIKGCPSKSCITMLLWSVATKCYDIRPIFIISTCIGDSVPIQLN